jgi:hypothetical protein
MENTLGITGERNQWTPFQQGILWKFLHRVLPTCHRLHMWNLLDLKTCPACHSQDTDTIDHCFGSCPIWVFVLGEAINLPESVGISCQVNCNSHVLTLLMTEGCLSLYFALLIVIYWKRRGELPPRAILASFKWELKQYIYLCYKDFRTFYSFWSPFVTSSSSPLVFHSFLV